jgi:hypothetical protein
MLLHRISYFLLFLFTSNSAFSQNIKFTYTQFDITLALTGNPNRDEVNPYTNKKQSFFLPDGIGSKFGYGVHYNKWIAIGVHSGLNWEWSSKLVVAPIFANLRMSPKINDMSRITLQAGLGKAIALGRGNLLGDYKKISLGFQNSDDLLIFIELNHYTIPIQRQPDSGNISLGIALISF